MKTLQAVDITMSGRIEVYFSDSKKVILLFDGTTAWREFGQLHRSDNLPAVIYPDGSQYWYKDGKNTRARTGRVKNNQMKTVTDITKILDGIVVYQTKFVVTLAFHGAEYWKYRSGGWMSRPAGPAIVRLNNKYSWYKDGNHIR